MDTIEKFNEQINNFKIGGKKAVKADLPVGDELKGSMSLIFGDVTDEVDDLGNPTQKQSYLVAINKGHPSICLNTRSTHKYKVIDAKEPVRFFVAENGQWVEKLVNPGEEIEIKPNTPFTYAAGDNGEALLQFDMIPKFEAEDDYGINMDWSENNAPSQDALAAALRLPDWRSTINKYCHPKKAEKWNEFAATTDTKDGINEVEAALNAIELIEYDSMDKAIEAVGTLREESAKKVRGIVLFYSNKGPEFFEKSFAGKEMSPEDKLHLDNVARINAGLTAGNTLTLA